MSGQDPRSSSERRPEQPVRGTLTDMFGRAHTYLRISVTDRCNLRCMYCLPPEGVPHRNRDDILRFDEIVRLAGLFAQFGVRKVRLTGGEPLVRKELDRLVADLVQIPGIETVALTTNGILLPAYAEALKVAGLSHLNISLDTLKRDRFRQITLQDLHDEALAGVELALEMGFSPLKLNVVVMGGINDDEVVDFVEFVRDKPVCVRFIEFMPFREEAWRQGKLVPYAVIRRSIEKRFELRLKTAGTDTGQTAKEFSIPGHAGTVGFLSPMSDHFCDTCNRLRLTADGAIKPCLFWHEESQMRTALRAGASDDELAQMIQRIVAAKPKCHPPADTAMPSPERTMAEIGG